jgi:hypothetical protein
MLLTADGCQVLNPRLVESVLIDNPTADPHSYRILAYIGDTAYILARDLTFEDAEEILIVAGDLIT